MAKMSRSDLKHYRAYLNGHDISAQTIEADAINGYVDIMDSYARYPGGRPGQCARIQRRLYGNVRVTFRGQPTQFASTRTQ